MDKKFLSKLKQLKGALPDAKFSRKCNVPNSTMVGFLKGNGDPKLSALRKIADAHGITVGLLVGDDIRNNGQSVVGDGNITAGGGINGVANTGNYGGSGFTEEEIELIARVRELGGSRLINRFMRDLDEIQKVIDGE